MPRQLDDAEPSWAEIGDPSRDAAWFHELDAWTEYWDVYHPETRGRFYFGDGKGEAGLLTTFLPKERQPPAFKSWTRVALAVGPVETFAAAIRVSEVAAAVLEVDALVARLFEKHYGDAADPQVQAEYIEAVLRCGMDRLPAASERAARVPETDWRWSTAGRHVIDNDLMWFAWALHLEASSLLGERAGGARRALQLAAVAAGCAVNFAWRGHRRTRREYCRDEATLRLVRERGLRWAQDLPAAAREVHALFRIREWGE